jgi:hypothetical protein
MGTEAGGFVIGRKIERHMRDFRARSGKASNSAFQSG